MVTTYWVNPFYNIILVLAILLCQSCSFAQKTTIAESSIVDSQYLIYQEKLSTLRINSLGDIFLVKNKQILNQYDKQGKLIRTLDNQSAGNMHEVCIGNGLNYLIYYKDFSRIKIVDRYLAVMAEIDLVAWGLTDIAAATMSNDNNLWLYDSVQRKLMKYSPSGRKLLESSDLYQNSNLSLVVDYIVEFENQVFLKNELGQLIILDNYGQFIKEIPVQASSALSMRPNQICFIENHQYKCISIKPVLNESDNVEMDLGIEIKEAIIFENQLFQLDSKGVKVDLLMPSDTIK